MNKKCEVDSKVNKDAECEKCGVSSTGKFMIQNPDNRLLCVDSNCKEPRQVVNPDTKTCKTCDDYQTILTDKSPWYCGEQ